jgi:hypothetical protein
MERRESMPWIFLKRTSTWTPFLRAEPAREGKQESAAAPPRKS